MNDACMPDGLWRRLAIENPDGSGDITTLVYWLQAGSFYADIRIPADRPEIAAPGDLSALPEDALRALARQHGFAGETRVQGNRCTWHRWLDYQPASHTPDEGRLEFNGRMLVEYGLHAPYIEHWWHEDEGTGRYAVFRLQGDRDGLLLTDGRHFMRAISRPAMLPQSESLEALLKPGADHEQLLCLLDCEISFGRCEGPLQSWLVMHSTLPWLEGEPAFAMDSTAWHEHGKCLSESLPGNGRRKWELCAWKEMDLTLFHQEASDE